MPLTIKVLVVSIKDDFSFKKAFGRMDPLEEFSEEVQLLKKMGVSGLWW